MEIPATYEEWQLQSWGAGSGEAYQEVSWLSGVEKSSIAQLRLQCKGVVKHPPVLVPAAGKWHWGGLSVA